MKLLFLINTKGLKMVEAKSHHEDALHDLFQFSEDEGASSSDDSEEEDSEPEEEKKENAQPQIEEEEKKDVEPAQDQPVNAAQNP